MGLPQLFFLFLMWLLYYQQLFSAYIFNLTNLLPCQSFKLQFVLQTQTQETWSSCESGSSKLSNFNGMFILLNFPNWAFKWVTISPSISELKQKIGLERCFGVTLYGNSTNDL